MVTSAKRPKKTRAAPRRAGPDNIQLAGITAIVLVLAGIAWLAFSGSGQASAPQQWPAPPPMALDPARTYSATITMAGGGEFEIELYSKQAPLAVNNFVFLARKGYFDGVTFHRVLDGFMAQGGDPTGTGTGGPGYVVPNEDSALRFDKAGVVAMANAGRDTNGSQFFITFGPQPRLDGGYTIFGQVTRGMQVVNGLRRRDPVENPAYAGDAISTVIITER
jgi:cyclophilin family peptidyl-prolyl cis-trans isomerase